jgi:DNA-binding IclR family transcriptional regulator
MLRKANEVLDLFTRSRREVGVVEAAALLGRPKSSTSRLLSEMEAHGLLDRDVGTGRYRLGMRLAALGELARQSTTVQRAAQAELAALAVATGETANLVVLSGREAVNVELVESPRPLKHVGWLGRRLPLHATAAGKALLSDHAPAEVRGLLEAPLRRYATGTITEVDAVVAEVAVARGRGYATAYAELEEDLAAVAAPVRDYAGRVAGALTLSAPTSRVGREQLAELGVEVVRAAGAVSRALGRPASRERPE